MLRNLFRVLPCLAIAATAAIVWVAADSERDAAATVRSPRQERGLTVPTPGPGPTVAETESPPTEPGPHPEAADAARTPIDPALANESLRLLGGKENVGPRELHAATTALVSMLRAEPGLVTRITTRILAGDCTALEQGRLLECLAAAGSEACQQGLLTVLEAGSSGEDRRLRVIRSLTTVKEPLPAVDAALARILDEQGPLAGATALTMAVLASGLRDKAPSRYRAATERVSAFLDVAAKQPDLRLALKAVGQLDLDRIPNRVAEAVRSSDPELRAAALRALGRFETPEAEPYLLWSLREDPHEGVRYTALEALAKRLKRKEGATREGRESPQELIRRRSEVDSSQRVRRLAAEVLAASRS